MPELNHHYHKDTVSTSSPNASVDLGNDLSMEFVRLQKFLGRVAVELHGEGGGGMVAEDKLNIPSDAVFITMLKYVMSSGKQSARLDIQSQMSSYSKALRHVTDCIEVLDNLTLSRHLGKTLMSPWNQVAGYVLLAKGNSSSQVIEAFEFCQKQFATIINSKGDTGSANPSSTVDNIFRLYMNRTLETVSQLSHTVQTTLDRMKTIPEELFAENKTAKKISHKLTEAVSKLNSKVQLGWKHVASKFEDVRKKWFGYSESKKMCKHQKAKEQKKYSKKENDDKFPSKPFTESNGKVEDKKKSYKQTKTAPTGKQDRDYKPQKHSEDFSYLSQLDDFFEDIHRAWRQHNNQRLRKVGGHIERLNEEMFLSMDDDDVEDMYEDLKDIGDDIENRDKSEDLQTWLSCQLRWWKTRIHRKHRAEDIVKGCGRQLMHWQLRVLCKQQKLKNVASTLPYQQLCDALMSPMKPKPTHHGRHPYNRLFNEVHTSQDSESSEKIEDWTEMIVKNDSCSDGGWYFRRVQDREDRRQLSPQWYFGRVEDRHFSRGNANWYVRAMRHNSAVDPVTSVDHQHLSDRAAKGDTGQN